MFDSSKIPISLGVGHMLPGPAEGDGFFGKKVASTEPTRWAVYPELRVTVDDDVYLDHPVWVSKWRSVRSVG